MYLISVNNYALDLSKMPPQPAIDLSLCQTYLFNCFHSSTGTIITGAIYCFQCTTILSYHNYLSFSFPPLCLIHHTNIPSSRLENTMFYLSYLNKLWIIFKPLLLLDLQLIISFQKVKLTTITFTEFIVILVLFLLLVLVL